jgi:hypothetical protein
MLRRCAAVSASMAALMLVGGGLAWAGDDGWGAVDCEQNSAAGCELGVAQQPRSLGGWGSSVRPMMHAHVPDDQCSYTRVEEQPSPGGAAPGRLGWRADGMCTGAQQRFMRYGFRTGSGVVRRWCRRLNWPWLLLVGCPCRLPGSGRIPRARSW